MNSTPEGRTAQISQFLRDCTETDPHSISSVGDLYENYIAWCDLRERKFLNLPMFSHELRELPNLERRQKNGRVHYKGLKLKPFPEWAAEISKQVDPETDVEKFYKDEIETSDGSSLTIKALYETYIAWCEHQDKEPLALPAFGREFGELGIQKAKIGGRVRYIGVGLKGKAEIPSLTPAAIEPEWRNNRLSLPAKPLRADLDQSSLESALLALQQMIESLADSLKVESNLDVRFISYLETLSRRIPDSAPRQHDLFTLAHELEGLMAYGDTVNSEWPPILAARFHALTSAFSDTVRQFPKWREFKRNANRERVSRSDIDTVKGAAEELASELGNEDGQAFASKTLPEALRYLLKLLGSGPGHFFHYDWKTIIHDIQESINNILKKIIDATIRLKLALEPERKSMSKLYHDTRKEINRSIAGAGKPLAKQIIRWTKRIAAGTFVTGAFAALFAAFPQKFSWIPSILKYIGIG